MDGMDKAPGADNTKFLGTVRPLEPLGAREYRR